ncbi:MAG: BamA/TamA family outer membrane protein [Fibrobacter sp.]|nr:BamA/TamA family outer membrane protein [Fibrobacter sp.]
MKSFSAIVGLVLGLVFLGLPVLSFGGECAEGAVVGDIKLDGLNHTKKRVVERELQNKIGEAYSVQKFQAEKLKLQDLDLFTEIFTSCESLENGTVELTYHLKEIFRWIPAPAGKKTDRDGLMLGLALANLNILGEDIRLEVQYRTSVDPFFDRNEYALYASSPYLLGLPVGWNFEFLRTDSWDNLRKFQDASWLADLDLNIELNKRFYLLISGAYRFLEGGAGHLPEIGVGFIFDRRDSELDSRKGLYLEYMLTHVGAGVGENHKGENYWEVLWDAKGYGTVGRFITGATALFRYRPGVVAAYDYFYHGGANTFRGHEADSLSLGVHEMLLTLEERYVLLERRSASVFGINFFYGLQLVAGLDGSVLWDEGNPHWDDFEGAVYGGVHLIIPALDRVRLEVGYSPDRGEPVFHFGLFDKTISSRWRSR